MNTGLILGALLLIALAILGWKFVIGNNRHNIATTIIAGANLGLEQILPTIKTPQLSKDLIPDAEYVLRAFFQTLGIEQYNDSSLRLALKPIPTTSMTAIKEQISQSIIGQMTPHLDSNTLSQINTKLTDAAKRFTEQMNQIQSQQKENVESCAIPLIRNIADELGEILFIKSTYSAHQETFQTALIQALDSTCANIYQKLSGKGDTGRYIGGGCC